MMPVASHEGRRAELFTGIAGLVLAAAAIFPARASAEERPIIAVFDVEDRGPGLKSETLDNLTAFLAAKLAECGMQVVPRARVKERLLELKKESYKECYDEACQIELGRELAAQKSVSSQVLKIGSGCQASSVLYDLKKAAAERAATENASCDEEGLLKALVRVSAGLCETLPPGMRGKPTFSGTLSVSTDPAGAHVRAVPLGKENEPKPEVESLDLGTSPLSAPLPPGKYRLVAGGESFREATAEVDIPAGKMVRVTLTLEKYPMNPYKKWGHVAFWTGVGLSAIGGASAYLAKKAADDEKAGRIQAGDEARAWTGVMWAGLGAGFAGLVTGAVLWALSPGDRAWAESRAGLAVDSTGSSLGFAFSWSW